MVTDWDTTVVLGGPDVPGTWKIGLMNTGVVVINWGLGTGVCCRMSCGLTFLLGTAIMVETIDVGVWGVGVEVMGLVTNTVIWLGEMVVDEAGICMTE